MSESLPPSNTAIRRWGDACFHLVDEVVEDGYILHGHLIPHDEVLEVRTVDPGSACPRKPIMELKLPPPDTTSST